MRFRAVLLMLTLTLVLALCVPLFGHFKVEQAGRFKITDVLAPTADAGVTRMYVRNRDGHFALLTRKTSSAPTNDVKASQSRYVNASKKSGVLIWAPTNCLVTIYDYGETYHRIFGDLYAVGSWHRYHYDGSPPGTLGGITARFNCR